MSFLFSPWRWVLKPATLPILAGAGGLFFGSYDITVLTFGKLIGTKHHSECSFSHKVTTFTGGIAGSIVGIYGRTIVDPPPPIPPYDEGIMKANRISRFALQSVHSMKTFPYRWYASSIGAAGVITGIVVSFGRSC